MNRASLLPVALLTLSSLTCLVTGIPSIRAQTPLSVGSSANSPANPASVPAEIEKVIQMPDGKDKVTALNAAIKTWAQKDPTAGLAWILSLPQAQYSQLRPDVKGFAVGADPKSSAEWLVQQNTPKAMELLHPMLIGWSMSDPNAAEAWCVKLQSHDARARHVSFYSVADGLIRKKADLATAWVAQLQPGADRLSAIAGVTTIWARGDIVAATAWIKTLAPAELKQAAQVVAGVWRFAKGTRDSPNPWHSVQDWLDQMPFTPADKEYVLKNPQS